MHDKRVEWKIDRRASTEGYNLPVRISQTSDEMKGMKKCSAKPRRVYAHTSQSTLSPTPPPGSFPRERKDNENIYLTHFHDV